MGNFYILNNELEIATDENIMILIDSQNEKVFLLKRLSKISLMQ